MHGNQDLFVGVLKDIRKESITVYSEQTPTTTHFHLHDRLDLAGAKVCNCNS